MTPAASTSSKTTKIRVGKTKLAIVVKGRKLHRERTVLEQRKAKAKPKAGPSLDFKRKGGIRKPSAIMRKTLKKLAKKREMEM